MLFWIIIRVALRSLWGAKLRSFLAVLGIIMGVGAVISMLSIVEGARREIQQIIGSLGTDVLFVWPDYRSTTGKGAAAKLTLADAQAVLAKSASVIRVSPEVNSSANIKFENKSVRSSLDGVAPTYLVIRNMTVEKGRGFTDEEVAQAAHVVILGPKTAEKLFGDREAVDRTIKINQMAFRVIGVLKSAGARGFNNEDDRLIAPYTTVQRQVIGRHADLGSICIQAASTDALRLAEDQVREVLRKNHRLKSDAKDDFGLYNQAQLLESQKRTIGIFTIVLGGVGGICLLTGGIGIMNIMLVIVTERTREIGLRKAIGAKNRDILWQFLLEAVLISSMGGLMGIAGGSGLSVLITKITPLKTAVSPQAVMLALGFATAIGVFFGFYPALRAAKMDPIEALARE